MSIELNKVIAARDFRERWSDIVAGAKAGGGPIGVTEGKELVGVFVSSKDYESMCGIALRRLLRERVRADEPTYSSSEALEFAKRRLKRIRKKR
jgi:hypothetical protein